jgi:hypothetical protein
MDEPAAVVSSIGSAASCIAPKVEVKGLSSIVTAVSGLLKSERNWRVERRLAGKV